MTSNPIERYYPILYEFIQDRSGIILDKHRKEDLRKVIAEILGSTDIESARELEQFLDTQPITHTLWQKLVGSITVGETYFYRNRAHIEALSTGVLPEIISKRRADGIKQLRIWSAGCATGEEPYSLAMVVRDLLPDYAEWSITILGTDINLDYLAKARAGIYSGRSFRGETPEWLQARWFDRVDGKYKIRRSAKDMVVFKSLNLLSDEYPSYENITMNMDMILCRNVTIYFNQDETRGVVSRFYRALNHGGWLVVGHSEPQLDVYDAFTAVNFEKAVFYKKPEMQLHTVAPVTDVSPAPTERKPPKALEKNPEARRRTEMLSSKTKPKLETKRINERISKPIAKSKVLVEEAAKPENEELWGRAKKAADDESWDEALDLLDQANLINVLQPHVHYLRGLIKLQLGDFDGALSSLRQSIYCDPNFSLAHYTLGDLYERQGNKAEAVRYWQRTQKTLAGLDPKQQIAYAGDDLTVEILSGLLDFRLGG